MASEQSPIRLGIVGVGKIVRDQHLPALAKDNDYLVVAAASRNTTIDGVANFSTIEEMLVSDIQVDAVSLCQPPQVRHQAARAALEAGKHVFLEKPPGATVSEVEDLKALA
ncbi:MAG: Gfo/Idh/MocA family oxidoreductase, partial [Pseudomonadota bacterium]|nr:Gfo/Idh/MocA family oxidoreductase [Pseudomonadota bacterium]